eukprot:TRINITY_DN6453_c0_g1_i3.p1 TRINITY_DN6453_c0_g1~~TRINITY_DN6453_c0_g1_i3.p1  ORF type:complete len:523 (-),score=104.34 TRINITY_DN6453_c0_g1_i3:159-1727(-)
MKTARPTTQSQPELESVDPMTSTPPSKRRAVADSDDKPRKLTLLRGDTDMKLSTESVSSDNIEVPPTTPALTQLTFIHPPQRVLIVKQWKSAESSNALLHVANYIKTHHNIETLVEPSVHDEFPQFEPFLSCQDSQLIDFCIVIGGDGTLLHLNSLFQDCKSVPPVLGLAMGSLGFLLPYSFSSFENLISNVLSPDPTHVILRTRLRCQVFKKDSESPLLEYQVLNELLVSRGTSPYLTKLEFYVDDLMATFIQADGVIIGSPTGSTAYSLSAGGAMMPPTVPGILVTPICPHTLSFRPIVLPDFCLLKIRVPVDTRGPAIASFDGRNTTTLEAGDSVVVSVSTWPLPTFSLTSPMVEWFRSIQSRLNWNVRELQSPLPGHNPCEQYKLASETEKKEQKHGQNVFLHTPSRPIRHSPSSSPNFVMTTLQASHNEYSSSTTTTTSMTDNETVLPPSKPTEQKDQKPAEQLPAPLPQLQEQSNTQTTKESSPPSAGSQAEGKNSDSTTKPQLQVSQATPTKVTN